MIGSKIQIIKALLHQFTVVFRLTYSPSFWKNLRENRKYWKTLVSRGYVTIQQNYPDGTPAIQTLFFLTGDVNTHIHNAIITSNNSNNIYESHVRTLESFKTQAIYLVPVFLYALANLIIIILSIVRFGFLLQLLK